MRSLWACSLTAILGLSACTGASTGVRSPCHWGRTGASTQRLSFVAEPADVSDGNLTSSISRKAPYGCDFQDF